MKLKKRPQLFIKTKIITLVVIVLIALNSCKKEEKAKTIEEFKLLMQKDWNIKNFTNSNSLLLAEARLSDHLDALIKSEASITPATDSEIEAFKKSAKSKNDITIFIKQHLKGDSKKIYENIQAQVLSIIAFVKENPDFNKLKNQERTDLITYILNEKAKERLFTPLTISTLKLNSNKLMLSRASLFMLADDCLYDFNMSLLSCDTNYHIAMGVAIASGIIGVIASGGIGAVGVEITMQIAITGIMASQYYCWEQAGNQMNHCAVY